MNGRVYAIAPNRRMVAIETELHGFTIVELVDDAADVAVGDEVTWESELQMGSDTYNNISTKKPLTVVARNHLVSKSNVRQLLTGG